MKDEHREGQESDVEAQYKEPSKLNDDQKYEVPFLVRGGREGCGAIMEAKWVRGGKWLMESDKR